MSSNIRRFSGMAIQGSEAVFLYNSTGKTATRPLPSNLLSTPFQYTVVIWKHEKVL